MLLLKVRENFIERVLAARFATLAANCTTAWTEMLEEHRTGSPPTGSRPATASPFVRFHTAHKLTCFAPWPTATGQAQWLGTKARWPGRSQGRQVTDAGKRALDELTAEYGTMLMEGLSVMGTRGKHVNVLQHLMGFLKNHLSSEDNAYLR